LIVVHYRKRTTINFYQLYAKPGPCVWVFEKLAGIIDAGDILSYLSLLLIGKKSVTPVTVFEYYALFQQPLLARGEKVYGLSDAYYTIIFRGTTIELLNESGQIEHAEILKRHARELKVLAGLYKSTR